MLKRVGFIVLFAALIAPAIAKTKLIPESGVAIDQQEGSDRVGWHAGLIGRSVVAGPLYREWNRVTIDTGPYRYQWEERKKNGRLVFTINEPFWFYRYRAGFLVVDGVGKTHKFGLVSAIKVK